MEKLLTEKNDYVNIYFKTIYLISKLANSQILSNKNRWGTYQGYGY